MDVSRISAAALPSIGDGFSIEDKSPEGFGAMLESSLNDVNELIRQSDKGGRDLAVGKTDNLHEAMIGFEKADTALKLMMQVRNKALEAYNHILSMQI